MLDAGVERVRSFERVDLSLRRMPCVNMAGTLGHEEAEKSFEACSRMGAYRDGLIQWRAVVWRRDQRGMSIGCGQAGGYDIVQGAW